MNGTNYDLSGRHYVVTGSTQGLGRAVALRLVQAGAAGVVLCGRSAERGEAVRQEVEELGSRAVFVPADLANEAECRNVVREGAAAFGSIHGPVNAAGITDRGGVEDGTAELWDRMMAVNARAPFFLMQECIRLMKAGGEGGSIVNMISDQAHGGTKVLGLYAASKGALASLTKNAAHAHLKDRIRVNGVLLGWMATPNEHKIQIAEGKGENWLADADAAQPFGRLLRPEDLAEMALFLLSDASCMMTGALIDYDQKVIGGMG